MPASATLTCTRLITIYLGKRRKARARPADGRPRVSAENQALRSDEGRGYLRPRWSESDCDVRF
jgi:hypothetical protein